ncbi:MAG: LysR substrate-binding domain-containing protein [Hyphomicrobiaceae bacterium]|nr:LysR substrate-binding domain-containing protein [Hyphomicrobiaceae bacterium]
MPNLRQLEYLVAVADTLHFKRAAERTNTTQPTLSEQLKSLEDRLGAQLVERSRTRVVLTPVGHQVVEIARRMLRDANDIRQLAQSGGRELSGLLRLGLPPTVGPYLLPHVLPGLHKAYPSLRLYVRESVPEVLPRALEDGSLDLIITLLPIMHGELVSVPLFREPLLLTVGSDHPLASRDVVRKEDLKGQDVLTLGPDHQLHETVLSLCSEFGANLRYEFEGTSLDTLREMVVMGLGVTFLPALYVRREIVAEPHLKTIAIEGRAVYRTVGMAWRKTSARQEVYERLAEFFRAAVRDCFASMAVA